MKKVNPEGVIAAVFIPLGFIFLAIGIAALVHTFSFRASAVKTTAVITDIVRRGDNGFVYIEYTANDETCTQVLDYYSSGMRVGGEVDVYYNPNNPGIIQSGGMIPFGAIFSGIGSVFFTIGILFLIFKLKRKKLRKRLMESGRLVSAEIESVILNTKLRVNGRHPYYITCQWQDSMFKSENLWHNPQGAIEKKGLTHIPLYIDEDNLKKYYVAVDDLTQDLKSNVVWNKGWR